MSQFDTLLQELASTRLHLEDLRRLGGSFGERSELSSQLVRLRAEIARYREQWS